ncbi:MAG: hypothetical protein ABH956_00330 [Candidatus Nealsonbacteria bacterium]
MIKRYILLLILISIGLFNYSGVVFADNQVSVNTSGIADALIKVPLKAIKWIYNKTWQGIQNLWNIVKLKFSKEIENKKPEFQQELKKEFQQVEQSFPKPWEDLQNINPIK